MINGGVSVKKTTENDRTPCISSSSRIQFQVHLKSRRHAKARNRWRHSLLEKWPVGLVYEPQRSGITKALDSCRNPNACLEGIVAMMPVFLNDWLSCEWPGRQDLPLPRCICWLQGLKLQLQHQSGGSCLLKQNSKRLRQSSLMHSRPDGFWSVSCSVAVFTWESAFKNTRARCFHLPLRRQTKAKEGALSSRNTSECDGTNIAYEAASRKMAFL